MKLLPLLLIATRAGSQTGSPSTELELKAQIEKEQSRLQITWINNGAESFLLNMGGLIGGATIPTVQLFIEGNGLKRQLLSTRHPLAIKGRIDPWVVVLPKGAEYTLRLPTNQLLLVRDGHVLADFMQRSWVITVQYTGTATVDHAPGGNVVPYSITQDGPTKIPFWIGVASTKLLSTPGGPK